MPVRILYMQAFYAFSSSILGRKKARLIGDNKPITSSYKEDFMVLHNLTVNH